jgi:uncharacterized coiled-coil DUF342 family protein
MIAVSFGQLKKQVDVNEKTCAEIKMDFVTRGQVQQLIERMREDRDHDNKRFEELYKSRNELNVSVEGIKKSIDTVETIMREFKQDVKNDINGLGKKIERLMYGERREYAKD